MVSASFIYLSSFTAANLFLCLYIQHTVNNYRETGTLPPWAKATRTFFERMDDTIKPVESEKIDRFIKEDAKPVFDSFLKLLQFKDESGQIQQPSSLSYLQLKPLITESGKVIYDLRDDHEYRKSLAKNDNDSNVRMLNDHRRAGAPPVDLDEFSQKISSDEPTDFKKAEDYQEDGEFEGGYEESKDDSQPIREEEEETNETSSYNEIESEQERRIRESAFRANQQLLIALNEEYQKPANEQQSAKIKQLMDHLLINHDIDPNPSSSSIPATQDATNLLQGLDVDNSDWINEEGNVLVSDKRELLRRYTRPAEDSNIKNVLKGMEKDYQPKSKS